MGEQKHITVKLFFGEAKMLLADANNLATEYYSLSDYYKDKWLNSLTKDCYLKTSESYRKKANKIHDQLDKIGYYDDI